MERKVVMLKKKVPRCSFTGAWFVARSFLTKLLFNLSQKNTRLPHQINLGSLFINQLSNKKKKKKNKSHKKEKSCVEPSFSFPQER